MKMLCGLLTVLALLLLQGGGAFAQSSDYETIVSFKNRRQSLLESSKTVQDLGQRDILEYEIARLVGEYEQHRKLLGEGLYPESFETAILALREQLKIATARINLAEESKQDKVQIEAITRNSMEISAQNEEYRAALEKMSHEGQELSARIQQLSEENAGLLGKIKSLQQQNRKDQESIARLKELTEKLNANIRDRDELVVKMMDSLFDEYSKANLTDVQKKDLLAIVQDNDYVSNLVATIDGNIAFVDTALLTPQDVRLIRDQQRTIAVKWEEIKPFVSKLYPDEQTRSRDITLVDGRLSDLKRSTDGATWKSLHQLFTANGVVVAPFENAGEFYTHLLAYIDEQLKNPSRDTYRAFRKNVWDSPVKDQWLPVIPTEELTAQQRLGIEERLAVWDKKISGLVWRWVLLGVFATIVTAMVAVMIRRKKPPTPPA